MNHTQNSKTQKKRVSSKILPTKKEQEINDEKGENQNGGWRGWRVQGVTLLKIRQPGEEREIIS